MSIVSAEDVSCAIEVIEKDGYVILENAVSTQVAEELAELVTNAQQRAPGVSGYEFVLCLLNHDQRFLELAMHPTVLALAKHLLGGRTEPSPVFFTWPPEDQVRIGSIDGLVAHPGSDPGWWHVDSPMGQLNNSRPLPDFPVLVNAIWALTPFTEETGATRVVPESHKKRQLPPPTKGRWRTKCVVRHHQDPSLWYRTRSGMLLVPILVAKHVLAWHATTSLGGWAG